MSSHVRRLQYHQQRAASEVGRAGNFSLQQTGDTGNGYFNQDDGSVLRVAPEPSIASGQIDYENRDQFSRTNGYEHLQSKSQFAYPSTIGTPSVLSNKYQSQFHSVVNDRGSLCSFPASSIAGRSLFSRPDAYSKRSIYRSRSLGASKASLASIKSGRSTIQAEHHDRKVQLLINAVDFQRAKKPYFLSVLFFTLFLFTLFIGLLVICLRHVYMNIILSVDVGESIGPLICAGSFLFLGLGFKFLSDAYQLGAKERQKIKYQPSSSSTVAVKIKKSPAVDTTEEIISGKTTDKALTRAPIKTTATSIISL